MGSTIQKQRNDPRPLQCTGLYCMKKCIALYMLNKLNYEKLT